MEIKIMSYVLEFFIILTVLLVVCSFVVVYFASKKKNFVPIKKSNNLSHEKTVYRILGAVSSDNDYENYDKVIDEIVAEYPNSYKTQGQIY